MNESKQKEDWDSTRHYRVRCHSEDRVYIFITTTTTTTTTTIRSFWISNHLLLLIGSCFNSPSSLISFRCVPVLFFPFFEFNHMIPRFVHTGCGTFLFFAGEKPPTQTGDFGLPNPVGVMWCDVMTDLFLWLQRGPLRIVNNQDRSIHGHGTNSNSQPRKSVTKTPTSLGIKWRTRLWFSVLCRAWWNFWFYFYDAYRTYVPIICEVVCYFWRNLRGARWHSIQYVRPRTVRTIHCAVTQPDALYYSINCLQFTTVVWKRKCMRS